MKALIFFVVSIILIGCGDTQEPIYDVDFYTKNKNKRLEQLEWCKESVDRRSTVNCKNAHSAQSQADIDLMLGEGIPVKLKKLTE